VWTALQLLFESGQFTKYQSREYVHSCITQTPDAEMPRLILSSESYGGHYATAFVTYFDEQNAKIDQGTVKGEKIVISALMINK
jgi:carboxypeptidase C (cathepsin A)